MLYKLRYKEFTRKKGGLVIMTFFWIVLAALLGASGYLSQLIYMKNLHEGKDLTNPRLLGVVSVFFAIVILMMFIVD
jgi:Na+-driven multidrug efflux pump